MSNDLCRKLVHPLPKRGPKFVRRHTTASAEDVDQFLSVMEAECRRAE